MKALRVILCPVSEKPRVTWLDADPGGGGPMASWVGGDRRVDQHEVAEASAAIAVP
jgi:hypothetical protein